MTYLEPLFYVLFALTIVLGMFAAGVAYERAKWARFLHRRYGIRVKDQRGNFYE